MSKPRLLVVDDEPDIAEFVCEVAQGVGYEVEACHRPEEFEQWYSDLLDVVVLDLYMPQRDGVELLRYMAKVKSKVTTILISGLDLGVLHGAEELAAVHGLQVAATMSKPIRAAELEAILEVVAKQPKKQTTGVDPWTFEPPSDKRILQAIEGKELVVHYQPKLTLQNGTLAGVEALVRWQHPEWGRIGPNVFLPWIEKSGLMEQLSMNVLGQALKQCHFWMEAGLHTQVAVNMSPSALRNLSLPEWIETEINLFHVEKEQISLEVTETGVMQELVKSLDILTRLRLKGLTLSIDDFGTGYSSLLQLYRIPFSELKIDRSFVLRATMDEEALSIVKMTTLLAHELGMHVVAEGVETQACWNLLLTLGCDVAQGFLIAQPMPGDRLLDWAKALVNKKE